MHARWRVVLGTALFISSCSVEADGEPEREVPLSQMAGLDAGSPPRDGGERPPPELVTGPDGGALPLAFRISGSGCSVDTYWIFNSVEGVFEVVFNDYWVSPTSGRLEANCTVEVTSTDARRTYAIGEVHFSPLAQLNAGLRAEASFRHHPEHAKPGSLTARSATMQGYRGYVALDSLADESELLFAPCGARPAEALVIETSLSVAKVADAGSVAGSIGVWSGEGADGILRFNLRERACPPGAPADAGT